jgi:hypothetical protein
MRPGMRKLYRFATKALKERLRELWHGGFFNKRRGTKVNALKKIRIAALSVLDYYTRLCSCYHKIKNPNSASSNRKLAIGIIYKVISDRR